MKPVTNVDSSRSVRLLYSSFNDKVRHLLRFEWCSISECQVDLPNSPLSWWPVSYAREKLANLAVANHW